MDPFFAFRQSRMYCKCATCYMYSIGATTSDNLNIGSYAANIL